ncbi:MAG: hypothetical protein GTN55_12340, partial [Gammaproteobacteria bacterium]|nr:hypothetical protein [Gammaproteobacteria bacterium]NIT06919.1 hypothetical protein [Gammaproteobacteria bacterium]
MGLLKEESGDFSTHHHVRVVSTDLTFIEAAKESGAGGYVDIRKSLTTGFNVVDSVMKAEAQTGSNNDPPPLAPWHRKKSITYALGGWFADLYLGPSITQDDNLEVRASGAEESSEDIDYDISITFGGRLGYWAWKAPQAATALDVSTYQADAKGINTSVYSVSLLAMFRHPGQELQPYIGIGPSLFITNFKLRVDLSAVNPGQTET